MTEEINWQQEEVQQEDEQRDNYIKNNVVDDKHLRDYLFERLGIEDKFVTGDPEDPIVLNKEDITDKQLLNIYEFAIQKNLPDITEEEYQILQMIRNGELEEYIEENLQFKEEPQYEDRDYFFWKMKSDFPDLTEEQIEEEFENLLGSDTYDVKIEKIKRDYNNLLEYNRMLQEQKELEQISNEVENQKRAIIDIVNQENDFYNFEIPDIVKEEVLRDIFESDNNQTSRFIDKYIDNPQGLIYTAMAVKMLPLIVNEYKILLEEYESLKSSKNFIETEEQNYSPTISFSDFDAETFANYLT